MVRVLVLLSLTTILAGCGSDNKSQANGDQESSEQGGFRTSGMFADSQNKLDTDHLKLLARAIHNHHDTRKMFPFRADQKGEKRNDNLSWRVSVLPYLKMADEYKKFDIAQPWDSGQNKPLIQGEGKARFTLSNGNLVCAIKHEKPVYSFGAIIDGSSNTIMLIENPFAKADEWTKPVDVTPDEAIKMVKSLKPGEFLLCAMFDGSCWPLHSTEGKNFKDEEIRALFGYNDQMVVDPFKFFRNQ